MAGDLRSWWCRWLARRTPALRPSSRRRSWRPLLEELEERRLLSAYTVISTADDGSVGTLRDAIKQVNAGAYNTIDFQIGAAGSAQTITLTSALPALTASNVSINGLSQGGSGNSQRLIELYGPSAGGDGLLLKGAGCSVARVWFIWAARP